MIKNLELKIYIMHICMRRIFKFSNIVNKFDAFAAK